MIITPNDLQGTMVNANLDDLYLQNAINEAEGVYLREILGDLLYNAIINKIDSQTLTGKYATLVDQYIKIYLQYKAQSLLVPQVAFKIRNAGVISQYDQGFSTTSVKDTMYVQEQIDSKAEFYANRLTVYLQKNADSFPEYGYSEDNITQPTESQNVTTIYLGTGRKKCGCTPTKGGGGGGTADAVEWKNILNKPQPTIGAGVVTLRQGDIEQSFNVNSTENLTIELSDGVTDYNELENKPDLSVFAPKTTVYTKTEIDALRDGLEDEIGAKASQTSLDTHTGNSTIHVTAADKENWNGKTTMAAVEAKGYAVAGDLATVATSGSYNDLRDIPSYFSYIGRNTTDNGVKLSGQTEFGDNLNTDISAGVFCNFKVDLAQVTKLYSDYIITGENTSGRNELVVSGDDGNNVYGKIAKDGIYEGNTKLENKYLKINDLPANVSAFNNDAGYLTQHQSLAGYATESWVQQQGYSTFDGNYNNLTNKPTIPSNETDLGLSSETWTFTLSDGTTVTKTVVIK